MSRVNLSPGEVQAFYEKLDRIEKLLKHQSPETDDPILTTEQVMNLLSVSRRCLQSWRDYQKIEYSVVNGKFYYRFSDINNMLERNKRKIEAV